MFILRCISPSCFARARIEKALFIYYYFWWCLTCRALETKSATSSAALRLCAPHQRTKLCFVECFKPFYAGSTTEISCRSAPVSLLILLHATPSWDGMLVFDHRINWIRAKPNPAETQLFPGLVFKLVHFLLHIAMWLHKLSGQGRNEWQG